MVADRIGRIPILVLGMLLRGVVVLALAVVAGLAAAYYWYASKHLSPLGLPVETAAAPAPPEPAASPAPQPAAPPA